MDKVYNPNAIETKWYQNWENNGFFKPNDSIGIPYCIMLPPPNVTGSLHMGHAFQDTIMDSLIRYHRMLGYNTLWQGGTDHAGIATQMVVERQLQQQGITRHDLGRDSFTAKVWEWKEQSGSTISQQMRRLGASIDWSRERFTMDEGLSNAVKEVFVSLYEEGLIYKGKRLVNWDPILHTAVSDLEVESVEEEGKLYHLRYPLVDDASYLIVATTRPETMLGDVAVAVHPQDDRFRHLIGKHVQLPLTDRHIPIIADEYVDPEFGTGCVKITPAHDFNDYELGKRHSLAMINIFNPNACLNENAPTAYQGMDRFIAREKILEDLANLNLMEKIEPHLLKIPRCGRTNEIVEPYLTDQWYVKVKPLSIKAIEAVQSGQIKFVPENWSKTFFDWMENIQDWCISRQLWWGHRIPAWYDEAGNLFVARSESEVREKYNLNCEIILKQEEDVLDTWFSSALWPFSTLGWPENTLDLKTFYPSQVLVTGFDIIFFWVARMIMMGLKFTGKPPFSTVYVHGLIQDAQGQKMSKSKGNVIDPLDLIDGIDLTSLIEKRTKGLMQPQMANQIANITRKQFPEGLPAYGTDALRFTFLAIATHARHIRFDLNKIEGYRNFCNKIWNAARYVFMHVEGKSIAVDTMALPNQWIWSQLQILKKEITEHIEEYRFDLLATTIYEFIWNTYCDWYLEFSKPLLQDETHLSSTRFTLMHVLEELMRILHPFMPYITEEIWQKIQGILQNDAQSIMIQPYPKFEHAKLNTSATHAIEWIKTFITALRNIRGEMNISPGKLIPCICYSENSQEKNYLQDNFTWIKTLAKISDLTWIDDKNNLPPTATQFAGNLEIFVPLQGLIDIDQETKRLTKAIEKHSKDLQRSQAKLDNPKYKENAPQSILDEEARRAEESRSAIAKLEAQLMKLQALH